MIEGRAYLHSALWIRKRQQRIPRKSVVSSSSEFYGDQTANGSSAAEARRDGAAHRLPPGPEEVAEAPWSEAEWAVALRFDNPRAPVLVLVLG